MAWTEFGYTGTSNSNLANTNYGKFTAASSGTVTKAGWKVKTVGDKCKIAITDGSSWLPLLKRLLPLLMVGMM